MTSPFRWAVLGPGAIARRLADQFPTHHSTLHAVGSTDPGRARAFADAYGVPIAGTYSEVLNHPEVDGVYVATVHTTHPELTIAALDAGKHVLCEKPLAVNHGQAMAMVDAWRDSGLVLMEAFKYRFHPVFAEVLGIVASGELGEIHQVDSSFAFRSGQRSGRLFDPATAGGGILDVGCYPVSAIMAIVRAAGLPSAIPDTLIAGGTVGSTGVDEWAGATLGFGDQITATVRTGVRVAEPPVLTITGSRGLLQVSDPWQNRDGGTGATLHGIDDEPRVIEAQYAHVFALEADAVAQAARRGSTEVPELPPAHSLDLAKVLDSWRAALGVQYPFETDDAVIAPLLSTRPRSTPTIPAAVIDRAGAMSRLVLGCDNQKNLSHASAIFDAFTASGGTTFDTAYIYGSGRHEKLLGRWIANRGNRAEVSIIAKGAHTPHNNPGAIERQLTESLERLGTDHVELYLLHRDNPDIPAGEFVQALEDQVRAGRIKAYGGSNWTVGRVQESTEWAQRNGYAGFAALSNHFSLARALDVPWAGCEHVTDDASRVWLEQAGLALLPWSSQARGFFTGRAVPDDHSDPELVRCYYAPDNFERLRRAQQLATPRGVPTTAVALAYVLAQPFPTFPLIGPRTIEELRGSLQALTVDLTAEECAWLDLREPVA